MSDGTCKTCAFCVTDRQGHEIQKQMLCFRNPPTAFPIPQQGGIAIMALRPPVSDDGWCGEWEDKISETE